MTKNLSRIEMIQIFLWDLHIVPLGTNKFAVIVDENDSYSYLKTFLKSLAQFPNINLIEYIEYFFFFCNDQSRQ